MKDFVASTPVAAKYDFFYCQPMDVHEQIALILCSSGTTGLPKGVQLTQYNLLVVAAHML
jgi:long-subunit acyl-CoA synthetase (AMP-forming)